MRLDIYSVLVKAVRDGVVASEICAALAVSPTSVSFHFEAICNAQFKKRATVFSGSFAWRGPVNYRIVSWFTA
jgi:hypothetical protein